MKFQKQLNLYIHIPYCKARCRFCNFYVVAGRTPHLPLYFESLKKELSAYDLSDYEISTIYFGGGTPSIVDAKSIAELLEYIRTNCKMSESLDVSIEMNPENITSEKLESYYEAGIRRVSVGLQAWQDRLLKYMGRLYTIEEFLKYYRVLQESKIKNINIDLIFGIPSQTLEDWKVSLEEVINLNPTHISCYSLEVDERSIYGLMEEKGLFKRADEKLDRKMYEYARRALQKAGFKHYEISNFAKPGFESNHNLAIWNAQEYLGLGASAHSYFNGQRFNNTADIDKYVINTVKNQSTKESIINVNIEQQMLEFILLQLRLIDGLSLEKFKDKFKINFVNHYEKITNELLGMSFVKLTRTNLKLTKKGLDFENYVISKFVE